MKRGNSPAQNPSAAQTNLQNTATTQLGNQTQALSGAQDTVGQAKGTLAATAPALSSFTTADATGKTPLARALTTSMTSSTNDAYNNAQVAQRQQSLQMGLQNQPLSAGNAAATENQRAQALGKIPSQVTAQVAPLQLQAAGLENQQAQIEGGLANTQTGIASTYNPAAYTGQAATMEDQRQQALNQQYLQQQQQNAGLWAGLAKAGLSFIPGASQASSGLQYLSN